MNRHHPYGGSFESPMRRGGSPSGPGPDRPQRFSAPNRGRGFGRGRGGYGQGSFDGSMNSGAYDQGPPGDMAPYNNYEAPAAQDPYYQNNNYGAGPPFPANPPPSAGFNQGFGSFEGALET